MSEFVKKLDDVVRQELSLLGLEYGRVVAAIEEGRGTDAAVVRMQPPYDDVEFDRPDDDVSDEVFAARVRRRLRVAIEAPERPAAPPEAV